MCKKTILIVEDEQLPLDEVAHRLKKDFYVLKASDSIKAWNVIKNWKVDCVITDVNVLFMSDLGLLEKIKEAEYPVNIIVTTDENIYSYRERCKELGAGYLVRPYGDNELIEMINAMPGE